jgi:hypothetical protein
MSPQTGDTFLRELQERWLAAGYGRSLSSYCAYESPLVLGVAVVPWASAFGLCNVSAIGIQQNHIGIVKPASTEDKPHVALRTAFIESRKPPFGQGEARAGQITLVPALSMSLAYNGPQNEIEFIFRAVVKATSGVTDAITDIYGTLYDETGKLTMPFSWRNVECTRDDSAVTLPFRFMNSELSCRFHQVLGTLTRKPLDTQGRHRLAVTFETDEKKGYTAQYCFGWSKEDLDGLMNGSGARMIPYAICSEQGVSQ